MDLKRPVAGKKGKPALKSISDIKQRRDKTENKTEPQTSQTYVERSMIPRLKADEKYKKDAVEKQNKYQCSSKGVKSKVYQSKCQTNLKVLQEKERTNTKHLPKIKSFCLKTFDKKFENSTTKDLQKASSGSTKARKILSEPLVFNKTKFDNNSIVQFENDVFQISSSWLKSYISMSNTLNNLINESFLESRDVEVERRKIQKSLRKARSFTLLKAKNVAEETKKLLSNKEILKRKLESPMIDDNQTLKKQRVQAEKCVKVKSSSEIVNTSDHENLTEKRAKLEKYESGDLTKPIVSFNKSHRNAEQQTCNSVPMQLTSENVTLEQEEESFLNIVNKVNPGERKSFLEDEEKVTLPKNIPENIFKEKKFGSEDLERNKKTINRLKNKVFEMQKACNDYSLKFNDLQLRLVNFSKKIYCDQLLLEKVEKSKETEAFGSNEELLDFQNRELESQISKLNEELEVLIKFNYVLIHQKNFLNNHRKIIESSNSMDAQGEHMKISNLNDLKNLRWAAEKNLNDKHCVIRQLNTILDVMKNHESVAILRKITCEAQIDDHKRFLNKS